MRKVMNVSLPETMLKTLKKDVKAGGFASNSEFVRHLIRLWNQEKLGKELTADKKEFEAGKGIELKSLEDLDRGI